MRVGNLLRDFPAIQIQHGGTYTDLVSSKPRQFDFRCSLKKKAAELHLAVECKNLHPSKPLVICGTKRRESEAFHDIIESRWGLHTRGQRGEVTIDGGSSVTLRAKLKDAFYCPGEFAGKSILRIKLGPNPASHLSAPDSDIYDKWAQAVSSSVGLAEVACEGAERYRLPEFYAAVLPAVVVPDQGMWIVDYSESGDILKPPSLVEACDFYVGREITLPELWMPHKFAFSHVHFFTLSGFQRFLTDIATHEDRWNTLFTTRARTLIP